MLYFDNAATTKPAPEALDTFIKVNEDYYSNTASIHKSGRTGEKLLEASRKQILELLSLPEYDCVFTSGATESNNIAIQSVLKRKKQFGRTVLISQLEHPSVIRVVDSFREAGFNVKFINTTAEGWIDTGHLSSLLDDDVIFVTVMSVNNIVGSVQPIREITELVSEYPKAHLHVDVTQAVGKVDMDYEGVDSLSISAHKFHGVKGIGALLIKDLGNVSPISYGGGHEFNIRSGTVNLPAAAAMAKALRLSLKDTEKDREVISGYNEQVRTALSDYASIVFQPGGIPHILNLSYVGAKGEVVVNALSEKDIMVSTTSACASKLAVLNETLTSMGQPDEVIEGSIRISFSRDNTGEEVDSLIQALKEVYAEIGDVLK